MKKISLFILIGLASFSVFTVYTPYDGRAEFLRPPEMEWDKTYGGTQNDYAHSVIQTSDGGYAIAGFTNSLGPSSPDFWLVKTDENGNGEWNRTYGGASGEKAYCVIQTDDGGYAIAGRTRSFGSGEADGWLVKTDELGNVLWNKTYGGTEDDIARKIVRAFDGGYAIAGETSSFGHGNRDFWLVKTDAAGNMEWSEAYGGTDEDEAYSVVQTSDGGYAIVGRTLSFGAEDFWLVKTNSSGHMKWNRPYGGGGPQIAYSVVQTSDGGYAIGGESGPNLNQRDVWLVKADASGNVQWDKKYGVGTVDISTSMVQTTDGGYAIAGWSETPAGSNYADVYVVKTDADGNMQWNRTYGGAEQDEAWCVVQTSDGGYATVGYTGSFGAGGHDLWLIKLAPEYTPAYSKTYVVDNSMNPETLTNYQVFINVTYDSDMQPDFDDLRFTWYNETSEEEVRIDYWLDTRVDSEYALIWVEVPEIRGSGEEVLHLYYGDPDAASESHGEETFDFFDGFSTDTTADYDIFRNANAEMSWNPDGWLIVDASERESSGRNSNVRIYHKTAQIDATEEKYWLETRCEAVGTGLLDYLGPEQPYKYDSDPKYYYALDAWVRPESCYISSIWGYEAWEFREGGLVPNRKDEWYRIGLGTSPNGTVFGRFCDDDYSEIETVVNQTVHQNNAWWIGLAASRQCKDGATLYAYFDYLRVRKFTDPEPSCLVGTEYYAHLIEAYFPYFIFDEEEQLYPTDFYTDDTDITNNPDNYDGSWPSTVYVNTLENEDYLCIQYWLYYCRDDKLWGVDIPLIGAHDHDWESVYVYLERQGESYNPAFVTYFRHMTFDDLELVEFFNTYSWDSGTIEKAGTHSIVHVALDSHGSYEKTTYGYGIFVINIPLPTFLPIVAIEPCDDGLELDFDDFQIVHANETDSWPNQFGTIDAPWLRERWNWGDPVFPSPIVKFSIVSLHEPGSKLYLHVHDNQSRHVGFNRETSEMETEIPGSYYEDKGNTTFVILPENMTDFEVTVDGRDAHEPLEAYELFISTVRDGEVIDETSVEDTVGQGESQDFSVELDYSGEITIEKVSTAKGDNTLLMFSLVCVAALVAVVAILVWKYRKKK